jgi:hypothetical protein
MRSVLSLLPLLVMLGCITRSMGELVVVSTRAPAANTRVLATRVPGEHCVHSLLGFGDPRPSYSEAARDAISKVKGASTMLATSVEFYCTGPLGGYLTPTTFCIRVEGEVGVFE